MQIDLEYEIKKGVSSMLDDALQYGSNAYNLTDGEHGDFRKLITNAKDVEELKIILHALVDELLAI